MLRARRRCTASRPSWAGTAASRVAPLTDDADVDYVRRLMSVVEGIPLSALEQGCSWDWHSFGDYLSRLDDHLVVNAGFLAGHSTIRRAVMGADATEGEATVDQVARMAALLSDSLADGALGFSSGWDNAHYDGDGKAVPSRGASVDEFLALAHVVGRHAGTTIGMFPWMGELPRDRMELMADMSVAADRPVNWNLLGSMSPVEIYEQQLEACDLARERGGHVVALALPDFLRMRASTLLATIPEFDEVLRAPEWERRAAVQDPDVRARLTAAIERASQSEFAAVGRWDLLEIAEPRSPETEPLVGLSVEQAAARRGTTPIELLLDVVVPEQLPLTVMLPTLVPSLGATDAGWRARAAIWGDSRVMLGGSDAGAHLDLMCHANYPTMVLGDSVRARHLLPLEEAVRLMTDAPARLLGLARPRPHRRECARRPRAVRSRACRLRTRDRAPRPSRWRRAALRRVDRRRARLRRRHRDRDRRRAHRRARRHRAPFRSRHRHGDGAQLTGAATSSSPSPGGTATSEGPAHPGQQTEVVGEVLALDPLTVLLLRLGRGAEPGGGRTDDVGRRAGVGVEPERAHVLDHALGGDEAGVQVVGEDAVVLVLELHDADEPVHRTLRHAVAEAPAAFTGGRRRVTAAGARGDRHDHAAACARSSAGARAW